MNALNLTTFILKTRIRSKGGKEMRKSLALIAVLGLLVLCQKVCNKKMSEPSLEICKSDGQQEVVEDENVEGVFLFRGWF